MTLAITYDKTSPYFKTSLYSRYLGYLTYRPIPANSMDRAMIIDTERHSHRPDLLAHDIYGDDNYWWVIPIRNSFQDPIFDLVYGMTIIVPDPSYIGSLI
jgi:hypothetical protein